MCAGTDVGLLNAAGGSLGHFRDGRHFASRFGLTTHEHSSGSTRKLRRIARPGAPAAERPRLQ
ncbi:transposase [Methyloversatilis sp.]|uniref:transposase n=1 Tax=Methyloversatilis sp. TaxID=2569862 RepID=UPI0035B00AEB